MLVISRRKRLHVKLVSPVLSDMHIIPTGHCCIWSRCLGRVQNPFGSTPIFVAKNLDDFFNAQRHVESANCYEKLTSGCGSSGIMVHGCMRAELSAVVEEVAIGVVKPWQKAAAVAATQRDSDSLMVAIT